VIEDVAKAPAGGGSSSAAAALVARRLHTRLPSFTEQFTQSVPLTRIRDIAHRWAGALGAG
jgi:phosphoglucan,water dikinase